MVNVGRWEKDGYRLTIAVDESPENPRNWSNIGTMVCSHRRYSLGDEVADKGGLYTSWYEQLEEEILKPNGGAENVVYLPMYMIDHSGIAISDTPYSCPWDSGQIGWIYATKDKFRKETGYSEKELFGKDSRGVPEIGEHIQIKSFGERWGRVFDVREDGQFSVDFDYNKIEAYREEQNKVVVPLEEVTKIMRNKAEEILRQEIRIYSHYVEGDVYGYVIDRRVECPCCGTVEYEHVDSCWGFYGSDWKKNGLLDEIPSEFGFLAELVE